MGMDDQYDQHDVHTVKMEHPKIIKNTVQRKNPIIQEKINQVRCKAKLTAFKPCRNRGRATRVEDVPVDAQRLMPTMQKVQNTKVVNFVKISQVQYIDEIVKDPSDCAETGADDAEDADRPKKEHPDTLCISTDPVLNEKIHDEQSRAAPEGTVPDEVERHEDQSTNLHV